MNSYVTTLTSLKNPKIKNAVKLKERRHRDNQGLMLIEGLRELTLALNNGIQVKTLFYCEELFQGKNEQNN